MKNKFSKILFSELKTLIRDTDISSNKKFIIVLELIQHLKFYNKESKGKFKRFFRRNISFFPQTYKSFSKIFNLEKIEEEKRNRMIWSIERELNQILGEQNKWDLFYSVIFLFIHILVFYFLFNFILKLELLMILSDVSGSIIFISILYFLFTFGSPILLYEEITYLTRRWDKIRLFIKEINKLIAIIVFIFYLNSWITMMFIINNPVLLDIQIIVQLIIIPPIIFSIIGIMDFFNKNKMKYYDDFLLYLHYFIILSKYHYEYKFDIPYFFRKLLNGLNDSLIYNFGIKIGNQEKIESKFIHYLLTMNSFEIKKIGVQLETLIHKNEDMDLKFKNRLNFCSIQNIVTKFEDILRKFNISDVEFTYITFLEKLSSSNMNKFSLFLKIILPIIGVFTTIITLLISLYS